MQLSFKLQSAVHHTGHLVLVPEGLYVVTHGLQITVQSKVECIMLSIYYFS
jgi:hypothetical protein